jgi:predicted enzyme related to lactoylglutathione lyase
MAGVIGWHELYTSDLGVAGFYAELLGAEVESVDMGDFQYPMLKRGDKSHAGFVLKDQDHQQVPSHWYPYVVVDEVDASVDQAKSLGSQLLHGPADVEGGLRFAVLMDPQHATYGVISSPNPAAEGLFVWDELHATDAAAAKQHYTELFGWTAAEAMENYEMLSAGETQVAGLYADGDAKASYWLPYLGVEDVDASTEKAKGLGAGVIVPPADIPNIGRFSVIADPTGAAVGLYKPNS